MIMKPRPQGKMNPVGNTSHLNPPQSLQTESTPLRKSIKPFACFLRGTFQKSLGIFVFVGSLLGAMGNFQWLYRYYPGSYHWDTVLFIILLGVGSFYLPPMLYYAAVRFRLRRLSKEQITARGIVWPWSSTVFNTATVLLTLLMLTISVAAYTNVHCLDWIDRYR